MTTADQPWPICCATHVRRQAGKTAILLIALIGFAGAAAEAQTFTVLHNFTNGVDGGEPWAGLSMDRAGNLYGTASTGGNSRNISGACAYPNPKGCGTVFKLSRKGSGWVFTTLYSSNGGWTLTGSRSGIGNNPCGNVIFDGSGNLYTTASNGGPDQVGLVFEITP